MRVPLIDPLSRALFCGIWNKERCLQLVDRFSFHFVLSAFLSSHRSKKMCLLTFPDIRVFPRWKNLAPKLHRHWCPAREETYTPTSAPASWRISSWVMCLAGSRLKFCDLASPHSPLTACHNGVCRKGSGRMAWYTREQTHGEEGKDGYRSGNPEEAE